MANFYEELNVSTTATAEEISKAYKYLARKYHPDLYVGDKELGKKKMVAINDAYATLSDGDKRAAYDKAQGINQAAADFYEELGVSKNATAEQITAAYKALARKYHPDLYQGDKSVGAHKMSLVNNAYDTLSDKEKRERYDRKLSGDYSVAAPKKKFPLIPVIAAVLAVVVGVVVLLTQMNKGETLPSFTLTYTVQEESQCTLKGVTEQRVTQGKTSSAVTAEPKDGYAFLKWNDGKTNPTRVDTATEDKAFMAICAPGRDVKFVVHSNGTLKITVNGSTLEKRPLYENFIAETVKITVTAVPNEGYEFDRWSDDFEDEDGKPPLTRTITVGENDIEIMAFFKLEEAETGEG